MATFQRATPCSFWIHVDELEGLNDFSLLSGIFLAIAYVAKFAQNCQILPKSSQRQ